MSLWQVFSSTIAAFFGVQTDKNRQRDFKTTSPIPFILMGIMLTVFLVLTLVAIVNQVLS
ncbi:MULTISPECIES: DUF2970 domain-containing protein [Shewanella]|uniref:DUF2970 domain-containing protein n=1 Tax=Shewanella holmiensis TaxID=2952222 RepID=A0A9X2WKT4_9GAMM|nr:MULTISPECIES: DUF2970 domain-containing protein [Shewanella]MCT7941241.1 DUF2970 domain-containing protein [Shewanella holmiensis]MDP5147367.1 DUF2970 domain-containing protein [Shewanella sp. ULN5]